MQTKLQVICHLYFNLLKIYRLKKEDITWGTILLAIFLLGLKKFHLYGASHSSLLFVFMSTFKLASVIQAIFKHTLQNSHWTFVFLSWGPITSSVCYLFLLTIYIGICIFQLSRHNFIHCLATCIKKILPKFVSSEISLLFMHAIQAYSLCIIQAKMFPATDTNPLFFSNIWSSQNLKDSQWQKKMNQTKYCDNKCCDLKYIYRQSNSLISALRECSLTDVHLCLWEVYFREDCTIVMIV